MSFVVEKTIRSDDITSLNAQGTQINTCLQEAIGPQSAFADIVGCSDTLIRTLKTVETIAQTTASVMITGETGTGKELIAKFIHKLSPRREKQMIKVNCASIPTELFESEFFGHEKGAFTGAIRNRAGRFELANGGTLFLDEVCEIPIELQSKLLRVLEESEFERIGSEMTRRVDVRIVAATNRDPRVEVAKGNLREDLYFRLNVIPLSVPPLRERSDDVVLLAQHFLDSTCRKFERGPYTLTHSHRRAVMKHGWPGNVRELRNVIERAVALSTESLMEFDELLIRPAEEQIHEPHSRFLTEEEFKEREKANITAALEMVDWRIAGTGGAAELLGIPPSTLANRMRKFRISKPAANCFAQEELEGRACDHGSVRAGQTT